MAAKPFKTRNIERHHANDFLRKANDFHQIMQWALTAQNWNGAGLAAVHCVISAADAVLVKLTGLRSASDNHLDTVELLRTKVKREGVATAIKHFEAVVRDKSDIEYSERELMEARALELVKHAERFLQWADDVVR